MVGAVKKNGKGSASVVNVVDKEMAFELQDE